MTVKEIYNQFKESLTAVYDEREAQNIASIIFEDVFQLKAPLSEANFEGEIELDLILQRLLRHEPWQYVLGQADFLGHKFIVNRDVLIPRPETEELTHELIQDYKDQGNISILDIGTGSGCIAISAALALPKAEVWGMEISRAALQTAERNSDELRAEVNWVLDNILKPREDYPIFDAIISNPPYVLESATSNMQKQVVDFEPPLALFVKKNNPLIFYEAILNFAQKHLKPEGTIYFEINENYVDALKKLVSNYGKSARPLTDMQQRYTLMKIMF